MAGTMDKNIAWFRRGRSGWIRWKSGFTRKAGMFWYPEARRGMLMQPGRRGMLIRPGPRGMLTQAGRSGLLKLWGRGWRNRRSVNWPYGLCYGLAGGRRLVILFRISAAWIVPIASPCMGRMAD